ncbi:MAG: threonine synthase [Ekhidna sp.]
MKFFSTKNKTNVASFREAVLSSLPGDSGLYFPIEIPKLEEGFLSTLEEKTLQEVAFEVLNSFCQDDVPKEKLKAIVNDALNFDIPLVQVEEHISCLELFHGPTMAFKDVGARFLARIMSFFKETDDHETTILVATSGDTGGAVASGFHNQPGINVVILYPSGKVSPLQERQMTTLGGNIQALEIDGNFDDCQALVKQAFLDSDLNDLVNLSSANSINIARWLPQSIYYYLPYMKSGFEKRLVFSIPSGNYGNITSGILAKRMGLPIHRFIAASNSNDVVPRYLKNGDYNPIDTIPTISNAMDVSVPSNFTRLQMLFDETYQAIIEDVEGFSLDDNETRMAMRTCFEENRYVLDPHSAIGYKAIQNSLKDDEEGIFLGTAHHCKFLDIVNAALDENISLPRATDPLFETKKKSQKMAKDFKFFKDFLASR